MQHYAASNLVLQCLPMFHKKRTLGLYGVNKMVRTLQDKTRVHVEIQPVCIQKVRRIMQIKENIHLV